MRLLVVAAVLLALLPAPGLAANCARGDSGLVAIPDLKGSWRGYQGGLYPDGGDNPPAAYAGAGRQAAAAIAPVRGHTVLLSIGMSNATQEFSTFARLATPAAGVTIVDAAQGGMTAQLWAADSQGRPWQVLEQRLAAAGVADDQVEAIWLKEADANPTDVDAYVTALTAELRSIVADAAQRFPNLREVFISPRTYAGYATSALNPEPYAYATGFADKAVVGDSVSDPGKRPWVGWGPYLWTNGEKGRSDGFTWTCSDVQASDGTHPSAEGDQKVAALLQTFFSTSDYTRVWYTGDRVAAAPPPRSAPDPLWLLVLLPGLVAGGLAFTVTRRRLG